MITVNIKMNGYDYTMKKGITILDASFETLKMQRLCNSQFRLFIISRVYRMWICPVSASQRWMVKS